MVAHRLRRQSVCAALAGLPAGKGLYRPFPSTSQPSPRNFRAIRGQDPQEITPRAAISMIRDETRNIDKLAIGEAMLQRNGNTKIDRQPFDAGCEVAKQYLAGARQDARHGNFEPILYATTPPPGRQV